MHLPVDRRVQLENSARSDQRLLLGCLGPPSSVQNVHGPAVRWVLSNDQTMGSIKGSAAIRRPRLVIG
jgi:hypothetical protein